MARAKTTPDEIKVAVKWDDAARHWVASGIAVNTEGSNKRLQAVGTSTTQAIHRATALFSETHAGAFEIVPDIQIPESMRDEFNAFAKDLKLFESAKDRIKLKRVELANRFLKDYHLPVRTVAPLLGMSQQRLGKLLADYEMGRPAPNPVGRPRTRPVDDED